MKSKQSKCYLETVEEDVADVEDTVSEQKNSEKNDNAISSENWRCAVSSIIFEEKVCPVSVFHF